MFVGAAYFVVAVLIPAFFIFVAKSDPTVKPGTVPNFHLHASLWGLAAGFAGAMGALCVFFATTKAGPGAAIFVAPLVFGGAPIINTLATIYYFHPTRTAPDWRFFAGLVLAVAGASLVLVYKPVDKPHEVAVMASARPPAEIQPAPEP
jgi:drug/metabolite transporter (DMT)-like permease